MRTLLILMTTLCCLTNIVTASRYDDHMHLSIHELEKKYNETEKRIFIEPEKVDVLSTSAAILIRALSLKGGREFLPFYLEKSLDTNLPNYIRQHAAMAYIRVATPDESISFLQVLLAQDESSATGWRFDFLLEFLKVFDGAISSKQLAAKSQTNLFNVLLEFIHSSGRSSDVRIVDQFLTKHCQQYETSKQRLFMSKKFVDDENQKVVAHYSSIQESIACVPPAEQHDLREQFPDLPPLPDEPAQKTNCQVYLMIVSLILVIICLTLGIRFYRIERPPQ